MIAQSIKGDAVTVSGTRDNGTAAVSIRCGEQTITLPARDARLFADILKAEARATLRAEVDRAKAKAKASGG